MRSGVHAATPHQHANKIVGWLTPVPARLETAAVASMEAATAALEALTVGGGESVLPVISGSRGHSPLALGGSSPVPGAVGTSGGAVPAAAAAAPVQIAGGPVAAAGGPVAQPNPENKLFVGGAPPGTDEETLKKIFEVALAHAHTPTRPHAQARARAQARAQA